MNRSVAGFDLTLVCGFKYLGAKPLQTDSSHNLSRTLESRGNTRGSRHNIGSAHGCDRYSMTKANQSPTRRRPSYRDLVRVIVVLLPWIGYCPENVAERETASISISPRGGRNS